MKALLNAFRVPPHMLGSPPTPRTPEEAARIRLVYAEAMGIDPFDLNDSEVEDVVIADRLHQLGVL